MEREHKSTVAELFDPLTPLSITVVGIAVVVLLAIGVALLGGMPGCAAGNKGGGARQGDSVKAASGEIGKAAGLIDKEADAIVKEAPTTKPHTDAIGEQTDALRVTQGRLDEAEKSIAARDKDCAAKDNRIKALEEEKKGGMQRRLIALVATGLIVMAVGIGLAAFGAKAPGVAVAVGGASLAGASLAFQVLLDYAVWITLGSLAIGAVWLLLYACGFKQVTHFAEQIKPLTDQALIEKIGREGQSWFTRVFVGGVRKKLGVA